MVWDTASTPNKLFRRSRRQLTVWYTGVMAVVLGLSGLGVYEAIAHAHRVTADRELKSVAETVHNALEKTLTTNGQINGVSPNLLPNLCVAGEPCRVPFERSRGHHQGTLYRGSYYFRVLSPEQDLIATAGVYPEGLPAANPNDSWQTVWDAAGNEYRQIALPLYDPNQQAQLGTLLVGRSFSDFATYLTMIRWIILLSLPITMGLIAAASWWLAGLALKPVQVSYRKIQQFTADAAHELRTPLTALQATAESVMRLPEISDANAREMLQVTTRQNQRLTTLVSDLLLLSRLDTQSPAKKTPCCLQDILSDIEEELAALAISNDVHLMLDQPQAPAIVVLGTEEHLYRLIFNLVSNALQHTPAGGKVSIRLRQTVRKTFPEGEKHQAVVTVEDTGIGIAPADQTKIFDRFYRVEKDRSRQSGGSGLGLSIALAIALAHGGDIQVQSQVGQGSTFIVTLSAS
ncbi:two-component system sensor histidine kinase RppB [Halomicronema sp. CCY15110]|uniref:two-component system sensor histidine kinase RppB n=1 Tax=Halomicronema sp. CCY15110 TaxID=2767773 RepID=UPI001950BD0E|nr:two-component system sensor histidine kinase RppB [Halomicronema sp. CCY15110]